MIQERLAKLEVQEEHLTYSNITDQDMAGIWDLA